MVSHLPALHYHNFENAKHKQDCDPSYTSFFILTHILHTDTPGNSAIADQCQALM